MLPGEHGHFSGPSPPLHPCSPVQSRVTSMLSISQMKELRFRGMKEFIQSHSGSLSEGVPAQGSSLWTTLPLGGQGLLFSNEKG